MHTFLRKYKFKEFWNAPAIETENFFAEVSTGMTRLEKDTCLAEISRIDDGLERNF